AVPDEDGAGAPLDLRVGDEQRRVGLAEGGDELLRGVLPREEVLDGDGARGGEREVDLFAPDRARGAGRVDDEPGELLGATEHLEQPGAVLRDPGDALGAARPAAELGERGVAREAPRGPRPARRGERREA